VTELAHTWSCPACGRRVPLRAAACHCGLTREEAEARRAAAEAGATAGAGAGGVASGGGARPRRTRILPPFRSLPRDVQALVVAAALFVVVGLGWLIFAPPRMDATPAVLGRVDATPPPAAKPTPSPTPPFKLPWWR
jgi:hypothetical protein